MHPDPRFHIDADILDLARRIGFAHVFVGLPAPMVAHAPVTRHGDQIRFHLSRANRAAAHLDGAAILLSLVGPQSYVSPNWYADPRDQVPTWNYATLEIEGRGTAIDDAALTEHLDTLAFMHEPRVNPAAPWTRAKMDAGRFTAMLRGIVGFDLTPTAMRATMKLGQNKSPADRSGAAAGLRAAGFPEMADAVAGAAWPLATPPPCP